MELSFDLLGFDDLNKRLAKLPARVEKNIARRAIRAGGKVLVKEAKARVPVDTGNLKKSLGQKPQRYQRGIFRIQVGARKGKGLKFDGFYAHMIEFGTKFTAARPFLRPAFDAKEKDIVKAVGKVLNDGIMKESVS